MVLPLPGARALPDVPRLAGTDRAAERPAGMGGAMTPQQMQKCADRLPPDERRRFLALNENADRLFEAAWALRKQAWFLYRGRTGAKPQRGRKS
jgi:hypothetical protein